MKVPQSHRARRRSTLSERYITDRFLPDKAIDLLDEACACCSLRHPEITEWADGEKRLAALRERKGGGRNTAEEGPDYEALAQIELRDRARLEKELPEQARRPWTASR